MDRHRHHRHDVAELRLLGGTLLIGTPSDPEIMFWQRATGQDRLSLLAGHQLRHHEDAAPQLRRLADRVGLCPQQRHLTNATLGETIRQAIDSRRLSALFLPKVLLAPTQMMLAQPPRGGSPQATFDFTRATRAERITEMLRRTPPYLGRQIALVLTGAVESGSVAMLGAALVTVAASRLTEIDGAVDPTFPAFAFMAERWDGLVALKEVIAATAKAATATRSVELDDAARQFAGVTVLGESFLAFILGRFASPGSSGGSTADTEGKSSRAEFGPHRRANGAIAKKSTATNSDTSPDNYTPIVSKESGDNAVTTSNRYKNCPDRVKKMIFSKNFSDSEQEGIREVIRNYSSLMKCRNTPVKEIARTNKGITKDENGCIAEGDTMGEWFEESGTVVLTDAASIPSDFESSEKQFRGTVAHEMAHGLLNNFDPRTCKNYDSEDDNPVMKEFRKIGGWDSTGTTYTETSNDKVPTKYGKNNSREDLSESMMLYMYDPERLKKLSPLRYGFCRNLLGR